MSDVVNADVNTLHVYREWTKVRSKLIDTASDCHALPEIIVFACGRLLPPLLLTSAVDNVQPAVASVHLC